MAVISTDIGLQRSWEWRITARSEAAHAARRKRGFSATERGLAHRCRGALLPLARVSEVTLILEQLKHGDATAANRLLPLVYEELRRIAAAKMARESAALTLQPTALVHEAWLRLGGEVQTHWQNKRHFLGAAAEAMRRILIERARQRQAVRHGGGLQRVEYTDLEQPAGQLPDHRLLALGEALERLAAQDPEKAELVKLRFFAGLTLEEAAATLDISLAMAKRWWTYARAWLIREVERIESSRSS